MKKAHKLAIRVACAALGGWLALQAARGNVRVGIRDSDALCVVELAPGQVTATAEFTVPRQIDSFFCFVAPRIRKAPSRISVSRGEELICSIGSTYGAFGAGRNIQPGTYRLQLEQEPGGGGAKAYVSDHPLGLTGWQLFSRAFAGVVVLSAVWALASRRSKNPRRRALARLVFHYLFLAFLVNFLYLLFHEGGHALAAISFGNFSLARSDFWGLHGNPSSGLKPYAEVLPWQRAVVSFAGPALPTLVGWLLFALRRTAPARRFFAPRPVANFFASAIILMCVFPALVLAVQLLGMAQDGDWRGFIQNVPGPVWLVKGVLWFAWGLNLVFIVHAARALLLAWRTHAKAIAETAGVGNATTENVLPKAAD